MTDKIGFIGVGTMGEPMCRNLAKKSGLKVMAADRDPAPLQRLAADGVQTASLDEIVASGVVPAQRLLDKFHGEWGGDITRVYEESF